MNKVFKKYMYHKSIWEMKLCKGGSNDIETNIPDSSKAPDKKIYVACLSHH